MTTFLAILCVVLIIYIIGSIVSFIHIFNELTHKIHADSPLGLIFVLFAFLMSVFVGVIWPVMIYIKIEEYFKKDKTNDK